jgi:tetratricopeptide (TPR) repeat protein
LNTKNDIEKNEIFKKLSSLVKKSKRLVGYSFETIANLLTELEAFFTDIKAFNVLMDGVIKATSERKGDVSAAKMLLNRGIAKIKNDKPYEAIRFIGQALTRLYKHESRNEMVCALLLIASAYDKVGLLWAARGAFVTAASIATNEYWTYNNITSLQAKCYRSIKWLELRLGRIPHALEWHETSYYIENTLGENQLADYSEENVNFDIIFGGLFLKTKILQLIRTTYQKN